MITANLKYTIRTGYTFSSTPTWGDEFDYSGSPDSTKWGLDEGNGFYGWGNNEQEYHRPENAVVSGNTLQIMAKAESYEGFNYSSAKLNTVNTKMFQYGRFEIRAKLPVTGGMWPAIFMFGHNHRWYNLNTWPECGELDIIELSGNNPNIIQTNVHRGAGSVIKQNDIGSIADEFNNYRIDWTPDYIRWFINNVQVHEFLNDGGNHSSWPFDDYFNLIICLNVGGNFVGTVDSGALPQVFEIDYVRYYELLGDYPEPVIPTKPAAPILNTTGGTKYESDYFFISTVSKPVGSIIRWYANGGFAFEGDDFAFPPESPIGIYVGSAVAVVDGVESEPVTLTVTVVPDP